MTTNPLADPLALIFEHQHVLQTKSFGQDPTQLEGDERAQYIRDMTLALEDELHEALNEAGWKPWASSRHLNRDAYVGELVDALHFLVNLFLVAGATASEVAARYHEKAERNRLRQENGYDGVLGKCPGCGRALDDPGVICSQRFAGVFWCDAKRAYANVGGK